MQIVDPRSGAPLTSEPQASSPQSQADPSAYIVDIDMSNFQQVVLEGSMQTPVLLDCWAPWCEPCKNLMPVLEKLAREYQGAFVLAKLNIDENQEIAAQLGEAAGAGDRARDGDRVGAVDGQDAVVGDRAAAERDGQVAGLRLVVEEEVLDELALVAEAQHEVGVPEAGVVLHDMPKNGMPAHGHHRLGAKHGFFR